MQAKDTFRVGHLAEGLPHEDSSQGNLSHYSRQAHQLQGVQFVLVPILLHSHWVLGFFPGHPEKYEVVLLDSLDGTKTAEYAKEPDYNSLIRALQRAAQLLHADHPGTCSICRAKSHKIASLSKLVQKAGYQVHGLHLQRDSWSCGFWTMGMICVLAYTKWTSVFLQRGTTETQASHGATLLPGLFRQLMSGWKCDAPDERKIEKSRILDEQVLRVLVKFIAFPH